MCYSVKSSLETQLFHAKQDGDNKSVLELTKKLKTLITQPSFHLSAFTHPMVLVYTSSKVIACYWGLIPSFVKSRKNIASIWQKTLNARLETILKKPSFKEAALEKRCVVYVDGFYEFHHFKGKSYPFFVYRKDKKPMILAALRSEWFDEKTNQNINTFCIVTNKAKDLMAKLHNNPKLKEARTPLILNEYESEFWLKEKSLNAENISVLKQINNEAHLTAHTVQKLSGKNYLGNVIKVSDEYCYKELIFEI